jgi:nitroreductase
MEIFSALYNRRSIRRYKNKTIEDELLNKIIEFGMYAPSAVNKQPWHFIIFNNNDPKNKKIIDVHPNSKMINSASKNILVCMDKELAHSPEYGYQDCSAAIQNILLAAHSIGLGTCWIGIFPREERITVLKEAFELPGNILPFGIVAVGYPDEEKSIPERFNPERIHYGKW